MRTSSATYIPHDETVTPLTTEQRAEARVKYLALEKIIDAARRGDIDEVKALASVL